MSSTDQNSPQPSITTTAVALLRAHDAGALAANPHDQLQGYLALISRYMLSPTGRASRPHIINAAMACLSKYEEMADDVASMGAAYLRYHCGFPELPDEWKEAWDRLRTWREQGQPLYLYLPVITPAAIEAYWRAHETGEQPPDDDEAATELLLNTRILAGLVAKSKQPLAAASGRFALPPNTPASVVARVVQHWSERGWEVRLHPGEIELTSRQPS